jgi:uncharacterized protein
MATASDRKINLFLHIHSSHSITADTSIEETAKAAEFFLSDGLIVTGTATGKPVNQDELMSII